MSEAWERTDATLLVAIERSRLSALEMRKLIDALHLPMEGDRFLSVGGIGESFRQGAAERLAAKKGLVNLDYLWGHQIGFTINLTTFFAVNDPQFPALPGAEFLCLSTLRDRPRIDHPELIPRLTRRLQIACDALTPRFGAVDLFTRNILPNRTLDLRRFAWGVTIYGPELVERIGREKLLKTPTYKVEELPWGGVWVQVTENPFLADAADKRAVETYLDLKNVFT